MFSYFGHCIYSAIQLSSCKCVLNKLSCHSVVRRAYLVFVCFSSLRLVLIVSFFSSPFVSVWSITKLAIAIIGHCGKPYFMTITSDY